MEILEAAHRAPSWADTQPWEVYVATGDALERLRHAHLDTFATGVQPHPDFPAPTQWPPALKKRMDDLLTLHKKEAQTHPEHKNNSEAYLVRQMNFFKAPVVIYLCLDRALGPWSIFDMGFFTQSLLLAAKEKGLDTAPPTGWSPIPTWSARKWGFHPNFPSSLGSPWATPRNIPKQRGSKAPVAPSRMW